MRIRQDTTWSGTVELTDNVVIGSDATLTVAPGTEIIGNGFRIEVRGTLEADGTGRHAVLFDHVDVTGSSAFRPRPTITLDHAEFQGGTLAATEVGGAEYLFLDRAEITNSVFNGLEDSINFVFARNAAVSGNVFTHSAGVVLASGSRFEFSHNIVEDQRADLGAGGVDNAFAFRTYRGGGLPVVETEGNAFLSTDRIALQTNEPTIRSIGDYFAAHNPRDVILDERDSPFYGRVELVDPKSEVDYDLLNAVSRKLYVHDDYRQPSDLIFTIALVGDRDASLVGSAATSVLTGNKGDNLVIGRDGMDALDGARGDDTVRGGGGNDSVDGGRGSDVVSGGDGFDVLSGGIGNDTMHGGGFRDLIFGEGGRDLISGGERSDTAYGGTGNDTVRGGTGADVLFGDDGNDVLIGGRASDTMDGGLGRDVFVMDHPFDNDRIMGFEHGVDRIDVSALGVDAADIVINAAGDTVTLADGTGAHIFIDAPGGPITTDDFIFA